MALRQVTYEDTDGRFWARFLPSDAPASEAFLGIPAGPPSLKSLGLPKAVERNLHNELFHRGILTEDDAKARRGEVAAALMAALKVDVDRIVTLYSGKEIANGTVSA